MSEFCAACHQKIKPPRTESLSRGLCESLLKLYDRANGETNGYFHLTRDLKLGHSANCNFSKLVFWNFVEGGGTGRWKLTQIGLIFVTNRLEAFTKILVQNGRRISGGENPKFISQILKDSTRWLKKSDFTGKREEVRLF